MDVLFLIILATLFISLFSFIGAFALFLKEKLLNKILLPLVSFSAGALMGGAFFHLLPESLQETDNILKIFLFVVLGFLLFFILENYIKWHHHHSLSHPGIKPFSYLILISDGIHNFIDGLIIAASFLTSFSTGIASSAAIAMHEIPQEIGDFSVLVYGGFKKKEALILNFLLAIPAIGGGLVGFFLHKLIGDNIIFLLALAAGSFIYISASDLIPEIRHNDQKKQPLGNIIFFLVGLGLMLML